MTLPRFVLVDFDGVLNTTEHLCRQSRQRDVDSFYPGRLLMTSKVCLLNGLVQEGVVFVLSSHWYPLFSVEQCQGWLSTHGFLGELAHVTPRTGTPNKAQEIRRFLQAHLTPCQTYVVIDDLPLFVGSPNFLQTDPRVGLTSDLITAAQEILGVVEGYARTQLPRLQLPEPGDTPGLRLRRVRREGRPPVA